VRGPAADAGWVRTNFERGAWIATEEARTRLDDREALAAATADQLAKLIAVLVRQERFSPGVLLAAFEAGLALGIVRRAGELARTADGWGFVSRWGGLPDGAVDGLQVRC
jgi:hypothetical protein